jgi:hypothetical protein
VSDVRSHSVAELSAVDGYGHRLLVEFYWLGDRYGHSISSVRRGSRRLLLESFEAGDDVFWPSSPPFQNLNECAVRSDSNRGDVTMLVGAAGKSHWAMCVTPRDHWINQNPLIYQAELFFDVSCRVDDPPNWLGSSYRVLAGQIAISEKRRRARVPANSPSCEVVSEKSSLKLDTCIDAFPIIRCEATDMTAEPPPKTVRWQYAVRLCHE